MRVFKRKRFLGRKNRRYMIISIFLILLVGIGYSYLSTSLSIEGYTKVTVPGWDIHFENIQVSTGSMTPVQEATLVDDTSLSYSLEFKTPGEYYEFTVDVVNNGTIDAMVQNINVNSLEENVSDLLIYEVKYIDGVDINQYDKLVKTNGKETIKVLVKLKDDADLDIEEDIENIAFTIDLIYGQADSNAKEVNHPTMSDYTWEEIITLLKANPNSFEIGDSKEVDMGTFGTHTIRVANTSTPSECSNEDFSQTACGVVLEFADIIIKHNMNPSGEYKGTQYDYGWNKDGYPASSMYTYLQNDIYNALPQILKDNIIDTKVISGYGSGAANGTGPDGNWVSTDKLYLLDAKEIYGTSFTNSYNTAKGYERQLDYYESQGVTTSNYSGAIKQYSGSNSWWWLRSANSISAYSFYAVSTGGSWSGSSANSTSGVSPAFRLR